LAGRPFVLFLGRIDYKKGLDLLIPSFAKGAPADAMLVLAGPELTEYGRDVRVLVARERIGDRVLFTGMLHGRDRIAALVDADLFALTSYVENFGVAVVEAMAAGTPVLISDQVNLAEMIAGADVGAVVPTRVSEIAGVLHDWLGRPDRLVTAGRRAAEVARSQFGWPAIADRWTGHYARLVRDRFDLMADASDH
ncbi:MAG TPA: glycosyltransferase, partial [Tepidisphaeraceae bacterium]|nr:glycosyltransferase [Tepidisphaeraceae bacterium]